MWEARTAATLLLCTRILSSAMVPVFEHSDSMHVVGEHKAGGEHCHTVDAMHSDPLLLHLSQYSHYSDSVHLVDEQYTGGGGCRTADAVHFNDSQPVIGTDKPAGDVIGTSISPNCQRPKSVWLYSRPT